MAEKLLTFENFSLFYNQTEILKQLYFEIYTNEILVLVGSSGAGKSLTAQAIMGLLPPYLKTQGKVIWHNTPSFGVILQNPASCFDDVFTIQSHFEESFTAKGIKGNENLYAKLLEEVELPASVLKAYPFELSGGMLQRIMIALALFYRSPLLIADEPSSDLDTSGSREIMELIYRLQAQRKFTLFLITHDFSLLQQAHRVMVMSGGEVIETSAKEEFFKDPKHQKTREFVRAYKTLQSAQTHFLQCRETSPYKQEILLKAENINVAYKRGGIFSRQEKRWVLNHLSFLMYKGVNVGIVGQNGAGKSTFANVLLGLFKTKELQITLNHISLAQNRQAYRRQIGIIFQNPPSTLNPRFTLLDAVSEPLWNLGYSKKQCESEVTKILPLLSLSPKDLHKGVAYFSGGEQQRIVIARAIITKPKLLILDEALSNLDCLLQLQTIELFKDIQASLDITYLIISHDKSIIHALCKQIFELKGGSLISLLPTHLQ